MTEGNCAILECWGYQIYLRGLVPCARLSAATASFPVADDSWWVITVLGKLVDEVSSHP